MNRYEQETTNGGAVIPVPDPFHHQYRELSPDEQLDITTIKKSAADLYKLLERIPVHGRKGRHLALARTKLEECVMWAVKGITE